MADRSYSRFLADVLSFGWILPASIGVGAGLGWLLDRLLGLLPVVTITGGFLGFAAGVWQLWREMEALSRRDDGPGPGTGDGRE
ncbi:MAG: AtpZ/AtpI family protein [Thermoanaerobaculia bacterium]